ncbi:hypothetical protein SAMN02745218_02793 [Desulfofundulus australicus DSM 11792]|jgi:hypothetical protein|uniref:Uncharacterized protein n=1 Tax=Desulfofundulus australicus DSM 11792 TaxID=1121425 RepID=A0A1M5DE83_9FIRM|nr:hypothetical protein [Desulfofundulus australicus]SHF64982.1 hypothetical protein SAMN02745218_02793 [Desulfofundulus australicus DSM 11792]
MSNEKIFQANNVTIMAQDESTGETFSASLPIELTVNQYMIVLTGEDSHGNKSEIAFLREPAIPLIQELIKREMLEMYLFRNDDDIEK